MKSILGERYFSQWRLPQCSPGGGPAGVATRHAEHIPSFAPHLWAAAGNSCLAYAHLPRAVSAAAALTRRLWARTWRPRVPPYRASAASQPGACAPSEAVVAEAAAAAEGVAAEGVAVAAAEGVAVRQRAGVVRKAVGLEPAAP